MATAVFIFKVALQGNKDVWRRIAVKGNQTLDDLHWAIFHAFDRDDEHLYSFYFPRPGSRGHARRRNAIEYAHPAACEDSPFGDEAQNNAEDATLDALGLKTRQKFLYLFDFGDEWWHDITVERTDAPAEKGEYPRIVEKHGESPPQYPDFDDDEEEECEDEIEEE
jgi:hypothetical protein